MQLSLAKSQGMCLKGVNLDCPTAPLVREAIRSYASLLTLIRAILPSEGAALASLAPTVHCPIFSALVMQVGISTANLTYSDKIDLLLAGRFTLFYILLLAMFQ